MKTYRRPTDSKDLREDGRIVLAHGEVTGHAHQVFAGHLSTLVAESGEPLVIDDEARDLPAAEFFEEPNGRRVLFVTRPCVLRHQEHAPIALDPAKPVQARQGDVFLNPIGIGAWEVIRQREYFPDAIRSVAD